MKIFPYQAIKKIDNCGSVFQEVIKRKRTIYNRVYKTNLKGQIKQIFKRTKKC